MLISKSNLFIFEKMICPNRVQNMMILLQELTEVYYTKVYHELDRPRFEKTERLT